MQNLSFNNQEKFYERNQNIKLNPFCHIHTPNLTTVSYLLFDAFLRGAPGCSLSKCRPSLDPGAGPLTLATTGFRVSIGLPFQKVPGQEQRSLPTNPPQDGQHPSNCPSYWDILGIWIWSEVKVWPHQITHVVALPAWGGDGHYGLPWDTNKTDCVPL